VFTQSKVRSCKQTARSFFAQVCVAKTDASVFATQTWAKGSKERARCLLTPLGEAQDKSKTRCEAQDKSNASHLSPLGPLFLLRKPGRREQEATACLQDKARCVAANTKQYARPSRPCSFLASLCLCPFAQGGRQTSVDPPGQGVQQRAWSLPRCACTD
jgi:hypothetical protein